VLRAQMSGKMKMILNIPRIINNSQINLGAFYMKFHQNFCDNLCWSAQQAENSNEIVNVELKYLK
jgi:hypothetical protein